MDSFQSTCGVACPKSAKGSTRVVHMVLIVMSFALRHRYLSQICAQLINFWSHCCWWRYAVLKSGLFFIKLKICFRCKLSARLWVWRWRFYENWILLTLCPANWNTIGVFEFVLFSSIKRFCCFYELHFFFWGQIRGWCHFGGKVYKQSTFCSQMLCGHRHQTCLWLLKWNCIFNEKLPPNQIREILF